jgi:capsular exopolysaccharide synthesis family protein
MENNLKNGQNKALNNDVVAIKSLILKYLKKWYWFVLSVFIFLLIGIIYLKTTNPIYTVESRILLRQEENTLGVSETALLESLGMSSVNKEVDDEIQILTSKTIVRNVITQLGLETEYSEKKGLRYQDIYPSKPLELSVPAGFNSKITSPLELVISKPGNNFIVKVKYNKMSAEYELADLSKPIKTDAGEIRILVHSDFDKDSKYKIVSYPVKVITEIYLAKLNINAVSKRSNAIKISMQAENTEKAIATLNKLIELYNLDAVVDKNLIATNTKSFIDDRLQLIQEELSNVEQKVESYKKTNKLTDLRSEAQMFLASSNEYDRKISEIETQMNLLGYIETFVRDQKNQYSLVPSNLGIQDLTLVELIKAYNEALLQRAKLIRNANQDNPVFTQIDQQLKMLKSGIVNSVASIKDGYKIAKRQANNKDNQFSSKIKEVPTQERQYLEIKRQQEIKQDLYLFLLKKREENALTLASTIPSAKTLDLANASIQPESPKTMVVLLAFLVVGLLLPAIAIYAMDLFNNKISGKNDLTRNLNIPFIGSIGISKESDRIVVREGKTTPVVEMFRMIRTNLQFMLGDKKSPVLLITSSIGGEGKSFTAINIAMSFALLNKKVVLLGLDIRKPMLNDYMHINNKNMGLTLYLSGQNLSLDEMISSTNVHPNLKVIPAGPIPPNPAELLLSTRLDDLIGELKQRFDYIIIDSAPVGIVSDTLLINRVVDNSIYVTRQDYTPRQVIDLLNDLHTNNKLKNISLVLNGVDNASGYGYGYGYGKGYVKKEKKKFF